MIGYIRRGVALTNALAMPNLSLFILYYIKLYDSSIKELLDNIEK